MFKEKSDEELHLSESDSVSEISDEELKSGDSESSHDKVVEPDVGVTNESSNTVQESLRKDSIDADIPDFGERYETISRVGQGGMGLVYKVRDRELDKIFAIKMLDRDLLSDPVALKRFEQEVSAASSLSHENLVSIYGHGKTEEGVPYLLMDYLDGVNLSEEIKQKGTLSSNETLEIAAQICDALEHAHEHGVIHRDIKPTNVILFKNTSGGVTVKVVDFGIATTLPSANRETHNLTATGEVFGSPDYMSPEQCLGFMLDQRSDIYSLGCLMYESMTGKTPFAGTNPIQLVVKHINEEAPGFPADVKSNTRAKQIENVVLRCLEKDQSNRYQSAADLKKDLLAIKEGKQPSKYKRTKAAKPTLTAKQALGLVVVLPLAVIYMGIAFSGSTEGGQFVMAILALVCFGATYAFGSMAGERFKKREKFRIPAKDGWALVSLSLLTLLLLLTSAFPSSFVLQGSSPSTFVNRLLVGCTLLHVVVSIFSATAVLGWMLVRSKKKWNIFAVLGSHLILTVAMIGALVVVAPKIVADGFYRLASMTSASPRISIPLQEVAANLSDKASYFEDLHRKAIGDPPKALAAISRAIEIDPTTHRYSERAEIYKKLKNDELYLKDCNNMIASARHEYEKHQGYMARAEYYRTHKQYDLALRDIAMALSTRVNKSEIYRMQAATMYEKGELENCVQALSNFIELQTNLTSKVQGSMAKAIVCKQLGKKELADASFRKVISILELEEAIGMDTDLFRAAAYSGLGDKANMAKAMEEGGYAGEYGDVRARKLFKDYMTDCLLTDYKSNLL